MRLSPILSLAIGLSIGVAVATAQTGNEAPVRQVVDPGVVTTGQRVLPAGVQSVFPSRVYGVRFGKTPDEVHVLAANDVVRLNWRQNRVEERVTLAKESGQTGRNTEFSAGIQSVAFHPETDTLFAVGMRRVPSGPPAVTALIHTASGTQSISEGLGEQLAGAVAVAARKNGSEQHLAVAALTFNNELAIFDLASGKLLRKAKVQIAPVGAALSGDGSTAWVSNWGGKVPDPGESTLPTGLAPDADQVVVDRFGIASSGTVSRVDTATGQTTEVISVGLHPTALVLDEARGRLYVANGNSDTVSVVDIRQNRVAKTIDLQPFARKAAGIAPTALALSPDGTTLYVACGGINAVATVHVPANLAATAIRGLIPTGWYPNGLDLSSDGKHLAVSTLLGVGSGWRDDEKKRFVHAYRGTVHVVEMPDEAQLESYTLAVAENNRMMVGAATRAEAPRRNMKAKAIPVRAGEPSLIEHVVYIIKENRTYDQVFGDMPKGNGDPSLTMFGERVTPNHHRLADQFVLLDNFYATGGNSGDGHQWVTQANEVDYALWPGYRGRSYPFDGTDPIAYSSGGFIWDIANKAGKTVRVYGEYAGRASEPPDDRLPLLKQVLAGDDFSTKYSFEAPLKPLNQFLAKNYPPYTNTIPDLARAQIFGKEVERWQREGKMPNLVIIQIPCDHTFGTRPGTSTPAAMVADNDWALGQMVEALTKSSFWKRMAIFVVEDDAQNGVDHVDGHRTVALAISPYTRRGHVDSTFYAQPSMLKTIELILGLPNMSLFDLIATDMRNSFTDSPDYAPYEARKPEQDLFAVNPPLSALSGPAREAAEASLRMRFDIPDAAPSDKLNRILWHDVHGWDTTYPGVKQAVFAPLSNDVADEDREVVEAEQQQ